MLCLSGAPLVHAARLGGAHHGEGLVAVHGLEGGHAQTEREAGGEGEGENEGEGKGESEGEGEREVLRLG